MRLIDADALMQEFAEFVRDSNNSDFADVPTWNDAVSLLGSAPTIEPRRTEQWIPCSEWLPDELQEVNVTWVNTDPEPYYDFVKGKRFTGSAVYYKGRWFWYSAVCVDYLREYGFSPNDGMDDAIKVIAWMPLPDPYQEERRPE